jgi:dTDP-4-dehydrorhamnose reductase
MNVLVLGGSGMLGHKVFQVLRKRIPETVCTIHGSLAQPWMQPIGIFRDADVIENVDVLDFPALENLLAECRPKVIVNCVGVIKQRSEAKAAIPSITINALLPHQLADICKRWDGKLIHFSTDCVFSGSKGNYSEEDLPDANDLYGRSKFLGEVATHNALTLRTSIIGRELTQFKSLLEWFLAQNHRKIMGYTRAFYSGVTTNYMAELVASIIEEQPKLVGLYQITSSTISKFELLRLLRDAFEMDVEIVPDDQFFCDRSMSGKKFVDATGYRCPAWADLVAQIVNDTTPYEEWRTNAHETV